MKSILSSVIRSTVAFFACAATPVFAGSFASPNNLVVVRLGDGATTGAATAQSVHFDEYNVAGASAAFVQSVDFASTGAASLTLPGVSNHDGLLNRSVDGRFLVLTGYGANAGTADPSTLAASVAPRVVGRVDAQGVVNATTRLNAAYDATSIRGAATVDGTKFWVAGDNGSGGTPTGGLRYVAALGAATSVDLSQVQVTGGAKTPDNVRGIGIFGGQLFDSSGSSSSIGKAVFSVGVGLPISGSQTATTLITDGQSVNSFYFADLSATVPGVDTLYAATSVADLRKYSLAGGAWTLNGIVAGPGYEAMTAAVNGTSVTVHVSNGATIQRLTDATGYNGAFAGVPTTILTAGANQQFRGVAFAPSVPECTSFVLAVTSATALGAIRRRRPSPC